MLNKTKLLKLKTLTVELTQPIFNQCPTSITPENAPKLPVF